MNVLDSALDAFAFNPANLGPLLTAAVSSLWAWVAVVTAAAFSFWRLRNIRPSHSRSPPNVKPSPSEPSTTSFRAAEPSTTSFGAQAKTEVAEPSTTSFGAAAVAPCLGGGENEMGKEEEGVLTRGDSFKNRFTVTYYHQEEVEDDDDDDDDVEVTKRWARGNGGLTVEIERRDWDVGLGLDWYGYQDRRVIDGSVVRLWEQTTSPGSCRRRSLLPASPSSLAFASQYLDNY